MLLFGAGGQWVEIFRDRALGLPPLNATLARRLMEDEAEFALLVSDQWQGRGLGTELLRQLIEVARQEGLRRVVGYILPDNREMQGVCRKVGLQLHRHTGAAEIEAEKVFDSAPSTSS